MHKDPALQRRIIQAVDEAITRAEEGLLAKKGATYTVLYIIACFHRAIYGRWPTDDEMSQAGNEFFDGPKRTLLREGIRLSFYRTGKNGAAWEVRDEDEEPWFEEK